LPVKWKVYQITTPTGQTYIGVTSQTPERRLQNLKSKRGITGKVETLAEFEARDDALALESQLVPVFYQSLNRAKGGRNAWIAPRYSGAKNPSSLRVSVGGVEYETLTAAGAAHGIKKTAVSYRLASPYYPDWFYVDPSRSRYWQDKQGRQKRRPAISAALRRG
jgi:hypothetical protein